MNPEPENIEQIPDHRTRAYAFMSEVRRTDFPDIIGINVFDRTRTKLEADLFELKKVIELNEIGYNRDLKFISLEQYLSTYNRSLNRVKKLTQLYLFAYGENEEAIEFTRDRLEEIALRYKGEATKSQIVDSLTMKEQHMIFPFDPEISDQVVYLLDMDLIFKD